MLSKLVVAENRGSRAEGKAKEYWAKFHTLEKKPQVEQDLRAFRSKLCESTFLQESVLASALTPSVDP